MKKMLAAITLVAVTACAPAYAYTTATGQWLTLTSCSYGYDMYNGSGYTGTYRGLSNGWGASGYQYYTIFFPSPYYTWCKH